MRGGFDATEYALLSPGQASQACRELRPAPGPPGREALGVYRQTRWCRVFAGVARVRERCGHYPWLERAVRDEFFALLRGWLRFP